MKYSDFVDKANKRWNSLHTWQPLLICLSVILFVAIIHKSHWELNTETNPLRVWEQRETTNLNNETNIEYNYDDLINETVKFKGTLEIFPYTNKSIGPLEQANGTFDEMDGLVYSEEIYQKCIISLDGMRILINGSLEGIFYENEIVTVNAKLVEREYTYEKSGTTILLTTQIWEAEVDDIELAEKVD